MKKYIFIFFVFALCFFAQSNNFFGNISNGNIYFHFKQDSIRLNVGEEVDLLKIEYLTNIPLSANMRICADDEEAVTIDGTKIIARSCGEVKVFISLEQGAELTSIIIHISAEDDGTGTGETGDQTGTGDTGTGGETGTGDTGGETHWGTGDTGDGQQSTLQCDLDLTADGNDNNSCICTIKQNGDFFTTFTIKLFDKNNNELPFTIVDDGREYEITESGTCKVLMQTYYFQATYTKGIEFYILVINNDNQYDFIKILFPQN